MTIIGRTTLDPFQGGRCERFSGVFGTPSNEVQGVIKNENGVVTLVPYKPNQFQINSIDISGKAVLYSGCLVQLGPANIFRFWDPTVHKPAAANKVQINNLIGLFLRANLIQSSVQLKLLVLTLSRVGKDLGVKIS